MIDDAKSRLQIFSSRCLVALFSLHVGVLGLAYIKNKLYICKSDETNHK